MNLFKHNPKQGTTVQFVSSLVLFGTLAMSGCGKGGAGSSLVQNVSVKTYDINNEAYVEMAAILNTGNIQLPAIQFPVMHPKKNEVLGTLALKPALPSGTELNLAVNLNKAVGLDAGNGGTLPNGTGIPVSVGGAGVIGLPIGNSGSKIYLALSQNVAVMGAAVVISEFDRIGSKIGGVNLFPTFNFGKGIQGVAGIFAGAQPGSSGIAVFVDASSVIPKAPTQIAAQPAMVAALNLRTLEAGPAKVEFKAQKPSSKRYNTLMNELYKMHSKRARVQVR